MSRRGEQGETLGRPRANLRNTVMMLGSVHNGKYDRSDMDLQEQKRARIASMSRGNQAAGEQ
jgi:hypothetical protein